MVINDREFGELVRQVKDQGEWLGKIDGKVDILLAAYNQVKGAATVLSPLWGKALAVVWFLTGLGALTWLGTHIGQ